MAYQLPWERPHIKTLTDAFKCRVMDVQILPPKVRRKLVVWRDNTSGETHIESMTLSEYHNLYEQVERYDVGVIVGSEWDSEQS